MCLSDRGHLWPAQGMSDRLAFEGLIATKVGDRGRKSGHSESQSMGAIVKGFFRYRAALAVSGLDKPAPPDNGVRTHSAGVGARSGGPCR